MSAAERTCRCFVTAWRVTWNRAASSEIEAGPPSASRRSTARRVGSPSAANRIAAPAMPFSTRRFDMFLERGEHFRPALGVVGVDLRPALERDFVEPGFGNRQPGAAARGLQREGDRGLRLARVVHVRVHRAGMPPPDDARRWRHLRDPYAKAHAGVIRVPGSHPHVAALTVLAFDRDVEPSGDLGRIGQGTPHACRWRLDLDRAVDAAQLCQHHYATSWLPILITLDGIMQPYGCHSTHFVRSLRAGAGTGCGTRNLVTNEKPIRHHRARCRRTI